MTSRASLLVLMAVLASRCLTQPQIEWQRCLGGSADDEVNDVLETPDGGYILACMTMSADGDVTMNHGWSDAWLVKLDQGGNIEWQRTYGGTSGERAQAIDLTADGGFIVAGSSGSDDGDLTQNHGMNDMWLFKVDATGDLQWQRSFGGSRHEVAYAVRQTPDGGYLACGRTISEDGDVVDWHPGYNSLGFPLYDYWVVKLDPNGNVLWTNALGGTGDDHGFSMGLLADGGCLVGGICDSNNGDASGTHGGGDAWVVRLDSTGQVLWQKMLGGSRGEYAYSISAMKNASWLVAGQTNSDDGDVSGWHYGFDGYHKHDAWVVQLDSLGNIEWQKCLGGSERDNSWSATVGGDGGILVSGTVASNDGDVTGNHGNYDAWISELDSAGSLLWQLSLGGSGLDNAWAVCHGADGSCLLGGTAYSNDGDVVGHHLMADGWVVKLANGMPTTVDAEIDVMDMSVQFDRPSGELRITGNGSSHNARLKVHDAVGRVVWQGYVQGITHSMHLSDLNTGIYLVTMQFDGAFRSWRFLVD
ncbi:MAG: T9SS type A sorting domain-containing protein [Flavobacteriales bacterium]|nr:T9SS type A sorting domain-containing protein [Flavobacteriales bacterium]